MSEKSYRALRVSRVSASDVSPREARHTAEVVDLDVSTLPPGDVTVRVEYSSVNYKDALSATGAPGVTREYPHIPGVDAAGTVVESKDAGFRPGDRVIVGGGDFGASRPGGYSELTRVPANLATHLPEGMTTRDAMVYGTAGLTAALCVQAVLDHGIRSGDVLVTGASGGVGSFAVSILSSEGFSVTAATGKADAAKYLMDLGARSVASRNDILDTSGRPLLSGRWDAVVDTVGGDFLASAIRACRPHGVATACGNAASPELPLTVFPFILRGITLCGIDSPSISSALRRSMWDLLAGKWRPKNLDHVAEEYLLEDLPECFSRILRGEVKGRMVVRLREKAA